MLKKCKSQGFTLIELMVVLVIIAIGAAMAVGMSDLVRKNRLTAQINTLISAINVARSEAITRSMPTVICRSANVDAAAPTCSADADWSVGWIVITDADGDCAVNNAADVLRVFSAVSGNNTLLSNNAVTCLTYQANGRIQPGVLNRTFTLTDSHLPAGQNKKELFINTSGRARVVY